MPACLLNRVGDSGTEVVLTAEPESERARLVGWSGACTGDVCTLTMDGPKAVTAQFVETRTLHVTVARRGGAGKVTAAQGFECTAGCNLDVDAGTNVTLRALPDRRSRLVAWSLRSCSARPVCSCASTPIGP